MATNKEGDLGMLSSSQHEALDLLRSAGGALDYQREVYGFAAEPDAPRGQRIQMQTAKALINKRLVVVERTKELRGKQVPDRISLTVE